MLGRLITGRRRAVKTSRARRAEQLMVMMWVDEMAWESNMLACYPRGCLNSVYDAPSAVQHSLWLSAHKLLELLP